MLRTAYVVRPMNARTVAQFDQAGEWLLKDEGTGFRLRKGRGSEYVMYGYLFWNKA